MEGRDIVIEKSGGMDPSMGMLMSMMNNNSGGLGGNSALLILALLFLGRGGFGGFGAGCGAGVAAAAGVTNCQDYLAILNAISGTKEAVAASASNTINALGTVGDRVVAASVASVANLSDKVSDSTATLAAGTSNLKDLVSAFASESSNRFFASQSQTASGFNETQRQLDAMSAATNLGLCQGFSGVKESICNSTGLINTNINNVYNNLTTQITALGTAQAAMECRLSNQNERTQGLIASSTQSILCAIENANKDNRILELQERLAAAQSCSHTEKMNQIIAINSTLQNQIGNILSSQTGTARA